MCFEKEGYILGTNIGTFLGYIPVLMKMSVSARGDVHATQSSGRLRCISSELSHRRDQKCSANERKKIFPDTFNSDLFSRGRGRYFVCT
jgi:hypothetical protein